MLYTYLTNYWRDIVEIMLFSSVFYYLAVWLKKNTYQNLVAYFYSFILLIFCSYALNLTSILYILACTWPIVCMLFILFHQKTLQHNFIALKQKSDTKLIPVDWLEIVVVHALQAINNNKPIYCIIEATDSMQEFIEQSTSFNTPISINAPISENLFSLIETSAIVNYQKMLYLQNSGILKSINTQWSISQQSSQSPLDNRAKQSDSWEYETLLRIQHTDAIAFFGDPTTHSFTLLTSHDRIPYLSAQNLLNQIKLMYKKKQTHNRQIYNNKQTSYTQELNHESASKKSTHQQRTP